MPSRAARACLLACLPLGLAAAPERDDPVTTLRDELGETLRRWWAEGTAAGNQGDSYDNRDRGHSSFDVSQFPQLHVWRYSETERARGVDWAAQARLWSGVTFGNSSTSAPATNGGSNPRRLYSSPEGLRRLELQYRRNNLYVYPEHQDHDPGHNGAFDGFGDLFPTNTPYLIVSQGSSGSDQPFLRAIAATLAAFRPEVKQKLVEANLLMPTLQQILRSNYGAVLKKEDYLLGNAHPSVFDGGSIDALKMAEAAHRMRLDTIPPLVQLAVVSEAPPVAAEASEDGPSERLSANPGCIARILRRPEYTRRLTVTAELSLDLEIRPLRYHWSVLRGDPEHVRIRPITAGSSTVEVEVDYFSRASIDGRSPLESNRVDIGVFAHNGASYSAPAFVTFFSLDSEARTYDLGRLLDIGYGAGVADVEVSDWSALLAQLAAAAPSPGATFFKERIGGSLLARLLAAATPLPQAEAELRRAEDRERAATAAMPGVESQRKLARGARDAALAAEKAQAGAETRTVREKAVGELAAAEQAFSEAAGERTVAAAAVGLARQAYQKAHAPAVAVVREACARVIGDAQLWTEQRPALLRLLAAADEPQRIGVMATREALANLGLFRDAEGDKLSFAARLVRPGATPAPTRFERMLLERLNASTLANLLLPGALRDSYTLNYVDPVLAPEKTGRDVFHYAPDGMPTGRTHFGEGPPKDFDAEGKPLAREER